MVQSSLRLVFYFFCWLQVFDDNAMVCFSDQMDRLGKYNQHIKKEGLAALPFYCGCHNDGDYLTIATRFVTMPSAVAMRTRYKPASNEAVLTDTLLWLLASAS
jgi:hypothetical protein